MFNIYITIHENKITSKQIEQIMASIQELSAKVDELQVSLDLEQEAVSNAIAGLTQTIADLQEQLANGVTPEAVQAIIDKVEAVKADLEGTVDEGEVAPV